MSKLGTCALLVVALAMPALAYDRGADDLTKSDVRSAQRTLDDLGYPVGRADGALGARIRTAIRNFQRDHGLNATGQLDDETLSAIESDTGARSGRRGR